MELTVNGRPQQVPDDTTVADVVRGLGHDPTRPGVAVAVGGEVLRRAGWAERTLADGEVVEVLTAVQGGA